MRKLERRAWICIFLALFLFLGTCVFVFRFVRDGGDWATFTGNLRLYSNGYLAVGKITDRNGTVLANNTSKGIKYNSDAETRKATVHAVGDKAGNISTGAENAFADKIVGYNVVTGIYGAESEDNEIRLSIDADLCKVAYEALGSYNGTVGVYNYKTGEIVCMVSKPSFDPKDPPSAKSAESGTFINKFLSGTFTPGSIFKTVTAAAAIDHYAGIDSFHYTCYGSRTLYGEKINCAEAHGSMDFNGALAKSCNGAFSIIAQKVGAKTLREYTRNAGLMTAYDIDGIHNAKGTFQFPSNEDFNLAWAGIGQWKDQVNPCSMMVYMGAVANGGTSVVPKVLDSGSSRGKKTDRMLKTSTANRLKRMMRNDVTSEYGQSSFPGLQLYAKTGTAEQSGKQPNAWFAGFLGSDHPYAFVVLVEDSGSGITYAGPVANKVLQALVKKY